MYHWFYYRPLCACRRSISTSRLKECHKLLEVNTTSTPKQIKESFLRLTKIYHPDNKLTGSHTEFVRLKQAYDDIKDAPTATESDKPFRSYEDPTRPHAQHKVRNFYSDTDYIWQNMTGRRGFGGPYAQSENPWEELRRDRAYRLKYHNQYDGVKSTRSLLHKIVWTMFFATILFSDSRTGKRNESYRKHKDHLIYRGYTREKSKRRRPSQETRSI